MNDCDNWLSENDCGRARAIGMLKRMNETGDPTLLLAECRKLNDPFYGGEGVGFFSYLASTLLSPP